MCCMEFDKKTMDGGVKIRLERLHDGVKRKKKELKKKLQRR